MTLVYLIREVRPRLVADLRRFFGVSLADMYAGKESVQEVAAMAVHIPRGGAVAEWLGGWGAISAEDEALRRLEYLLNAQLVQGSGKKRKIPVPEMPKSLRDAEIREKRDAQRRADKKRALESMARALGQG